MNTTTTAVQKDFSSEMGLVRREPTALDMIQSVIDKGVTAENVNALRELVALKRDMDKDAAEKAFAAAFVALQAALPVITAKTIIPNRGRYEKFEDVMAAIADCLKSHGFSVSFSMDFKENRVIETCHLSHIGGHSRANSFAVRTRKADSDTQSDCMAATTAKRNALCNALNIVIRQDCLNNEEDAGIEGDPNAKVTPDQAFELERRVHESNSDVKAFLKVAEASQFGDIPARNYGMLHDLLSRKERRSK